MTVLCFWISSFLYAQSIKGIVSDHETNEPIADVHVQLANSHVGTITDKEGKFVLEGFLVDSARIRISAIGYTTLEQIVSSNNSEVQIHLAPSIILLNNAVTITAQRNERLTFDVPESITSVSRVQIEQQAPRSAPEALTNETGIWIQKTNHGGGSPIIRGLVGNQVLLLVDGINQMYALKYV